MNAEQWPAATAETHTAALFFFGDRVYKVKKPVRLPFLDFSTPALRATACQHEVDLNRRLSPDVYLGVAELRLAGEPSEPVVVMRRMPADRRLATLVASGADGRDEVAAIARIVAAFHASAESSPEIDAAARADAMRALWSASVTQCRDFTAVLDQHVLDHVARRADTYLHGRAGLLAARIRDGRARDGHGDLMAEDIFCLDDGPRILDCIEFDEHLRCGDTLLDIAFLAMDLERLDRADLSTWLLDRYREFSGDVWPRSLADHYVAYRALVRSKVACIRHSQGDAASADAARSLLSLTAAHLDAATVRLVLVGGAPGTGKSTLATALGEALGSTVIRSDVVRKELAGTPADEHGAGRFGEGLYIDAAKDATYDEMIVRARAALHFGETVILDASWLDEPRRATARQLASETAAEIVELRCDAPAAVAATRIAARAERGADPSDATAEIAARLAAAASPWPGAVTIDTTASVEDCVAAALDRVTDSNLV